MGRLGQVFKLIRQFGLCKLAGMNRRHNRALPVVRGYVTIRVFWALLHLGVLDELAERKDGAVSELAGKFGLDEDILRHLCEYLDCVRVLEQTGPDRFAFARFGRVLMAEPRGVIDLMYGYEPILVSLEDMLTGRRKYGDDLSRREKYIAMGSGELGLQLPFPIMADIVGRHGFRRLLDLGCGDLEFLLTVCRLTGARGFGIDVSADAIEHAKPRLAASELADRVEVARADMFDLSTVASQWPDIDCLTVCDTFHEHLQRGTGKIEALLVQLGELFPKASVLVAEFCRQSHEELKKRPTGFLEHHLFHALTRQTILSAHEWHGLFKRSGWKVVEERVFDVVGHGYFLLSRGVSGSTSSPE